MEERSRKRVCYLKKGTDASTPICRYMKFEHFVEMLETKKMFILRKQHFEDPTEKYPPLRSVFSQFTPVIIGTTPDKQRTEKETQKLSDILSQLEEAKVLPTLCWTSRLGENYLMWKSYAPKGVRIQSTINKVVLSVVKDEHKIICAPIEYNDFKNLHDIDEFIFSKNKFFSDEKEIRFYFEENGIKKDNIDDHILLEIEPNEMINEVVISPFIKPIAARKLAAMIQEKYGIGVVTSKISLNI